MQQHQWVLRCCACLLRVMHVPIASEKPHTYCWTRLHTTGNWLEPLQTAGDALVGRGGASASSYPGGSPTGS